MSNSGTFTPKITDKFWIDSPPVIDKFWIDDTTAHSIQPIQNTSTVQQDYAVQGRCIQAKEVFSSFALETASAAYDMEREIKKKLTYKIAEEMLQAKCVEFTKQADGLTGEYIFRARIFVTPDSQVRLLRQANIIK